MKSLEDIFTESYLPQYTRLYTIARAIVGDTDAADAVQDTMVKIWKSGEAMRTTLNARAYAVTVLRTTAIDLLRRRRNNDSLEQVREIKSDVSPDPDTAEFLDRCISTLSDNQQEVIRLSAYSDMSVDEIARTTGLTPANVRQLLSRGRKKIKELYTKYMQP